MYADTSSSDKVQAAPLIFSRCSSVPPLWLYEFYVDYPFNREFYIIYFIFYFIFCQGIIKISVNISKILSDNTQ